MRGNLCLLLCCSEAKSCLAPQQLMRHGWYNQAVETTCHERHENDYKLNLQYNAVVVKSKKETAKSLISLHHVCYRKSSLPPKVADIPSPSKQASYMLWFYPECKIHTRREDAFKCDRALGGIGAYGRTVQSCQVWLCVCVWLLLSVPHRAPLTWPCWTSAPRQQVWTPPCAPRSEWESLKATRCLLSATDSRDSTRDRWDWN